MASVRSTAVDRGPILVAAACIVRDESILLARRHQPDFPAVHNRWELPGGKVKIGETPAQTVRREIEEELGFSVHLVRLLPHVQTNLYHRPDGSSSHFAIVAYECVPARGAQLRVDPDVVSGLRWIRQAEASGLDLLPGTIEFLNSRSRLEGSFCAPFAVLLSRTEGGRRDYSTFEILRDLWGDISMIERQVNRKTKSTHRRVTCLSEEEAYRAVAARVRALARVGYEVEESTNPHLAPLP